ncbi:hypothetical protein QR680_011542 [Steinernema hermaphroditum]|uniref:Peptidase metallopeptidase domain-containing protein n=1 Tax=Steinernema hermaphroditum TaxID=289476 RepID=A0AA39LY91_9BILA|nr:hypothetical protein QR680_011542 [Steinernema hermaphroditum]
MSIHRFGLLSVLILWLDCSVAFSLDIESDEIDYLQRFGYIDVDLSDAQITPSFWSDKIREFQDMVDLPQTGEMDAETKKAMKANRCGVADKFKDDRRRVRRHGNRGRRYIKPEYKWPKTDLTYWIRNTPRYLQDRDAIRREIGAAFQAWSDASGLTFREVSSVDGKDVDITLSFQWKKHENCPHAFSHGFLAHAFKYTNNYEFSGDVHFNDEYNFKSSPVSESDDRRGVQNLRAIAMHEIGHSLGIDHQNTKDSIMFSLYQNNNDHPKLSSLDVNVIQSTYGPNRTPSHRYRHPSRPTEPRVNPEPPRVPHHRHHHPDEPTLCTSTIDAAVMYRGELLIFIRNFMWRFRDDRFIGRPIEASSMFRDLPKTIDAVVNVNDQLLFFSESQVYVYRLLTLVTVLPLTHLGLPHHIRRVRLAFTWNSRIYIFDQHEFRELDPRSLKVKGDRKIIRYQWVGLPQEVSAAYESDNGLNFLHKNMVYRYETDDGSRPPIVEQFKLCRKDFQHEHSVPYPRRVLTATECSVEECPSSAESHFHWFLIMIATLLMCV